MTSWSKQTNIQGPAGADSTVPGPQGPVGNDGTPGAKGDPGPTAVSKDADNASILGTDRLLYTPKPAGFVKIPGDTMIGPLVINSAATTGFSTPALDTPGRDILVNNLRIGTGAGGGAMGGNTVIGEKAFDWNTDGFHNVAVGYQALYRNSSGTLNVAIGYGSAINTTTGGDNVVVGGGALAKNVDGSNNVCLGSGAMQSTGPSLSGNIAIGLVALANLNSGSGNIGIGTGALGSSGPGVDNIAIGANTLNGSSAGDNNVCLGVGANALGTGSYNTAIGSNALFGLTSGSGNLGIGGTDANGFPSPAFTITTENNRISLGSTNTTNAYVQVAWTVVSDERDKMNFASVPYGLDFVNALKPTAYQFKISRDSEEPNGPVRYGFKAQDILALEGGTGVIIDNEDPDKLRYNGEALVPVLVNAVNELTAMVKTLQAEVAGLKNV